MMVVMMVVAVASLVVCGPTLQTNPLEAAVMFASVLIHALPSVHLDQWGNTALSLFLLELCAVFKVVALSQIRHCCPALPRRSSSSSTVELKVALSYDYCKF